MGAREGKEVKNGFLESESLPAQKFQGFEGGKMMVIIIFVTLELSTCEESDPRGMQNIVQRAPGCQSGNLSLWHAFLPTLFLTLGESLPFEGPDKEADFIKSEMGKH